MKVTNSLKNRCGIFLFYDRDGIVDDYIIYMLRELKKSISHILVVCNGAPQENEIDKLKNVSDDLLIRENTGFDVGGYREGLFYIGFDELEKYDEVIMLNYTFFGGIYPFEEMFEKMSEMDLDFWGITKHHYVKEDPYRKIKYGCIPEHIQSHFLVLRRSLVSSIDYKDFITSMENPKSYVESICNYEAIFTRHFSDLGYKWDTYVDSNRFEKYVYSPVMFSLPALFEEDRCPIIKRRSFFTDYSDYLINTCGEPSVNAYEYIAHNTNYDVNMIWDNILRLENMTEVQRVMQLNYFIPDDVRFADENIQDAKICLWIKNTDSLEYYEKYLKNVTGSYNLALYGEQEKLDDVKTLLEDQDNVELHVAIFESIQGFFRCLKDDISSNIKYYGIGVIDTVEKIKPYSNVISNVYKDWSCTLPSEDFIVNVKETFFENSRLGLIIPPMPDFGEYFENYADEWNGRYEDVDEYLNSLGIKANMKKDVPPLFSTTGNLWIRKDVLSGNWMQEALKRDVDDEVFLCALYLITQKEGYYTGILYSNAYAEIEMTNSDYIMRELNKAVFRVYAPGFHKVVLDRVKNEDYEGLKASTLSNRIKVKVNKVLKKCLPSKAYDKSKMLYFRMTRR